MINETRPLTVHVFLELKDKVMAKLECIKITSSSGRGGVFVEIKFIVPFQYKPQVLKHNFKIAVNKKLFRDYTHYDL